MFVIKRDGRQEPVHFDKITSRIKKLAYGLNADFCDPVRASDPHLNRAPSSLARHRARGRRGASTAYPHTPVPVTPASLPRYARQPTRQPTRPLGALYPPNRLRGRGAVIRYRACGYVRKP
jgi:hypothetical protein